MKTLERSEKQALTEANGRQVVKTRPRKLMLAEGPRQAQRLEEPALAESNWNESLKEGWIRSK